MTYDPTSGTLNALVSDGRLGLIEDLELRDGLASWLRALQDINENEDYLDEFRKKGGSGVPLIEVGDELMRGFDENRLSKMLTQT